MIDLDTIKIAMRPMLRPVLFFMVGFWLSLSKLLQWGRAFMKEVRGIVDDIEKEQQT